MAAKTKNTTEQKPRVSKRERRMKIIIYIMIFGMVLSTIAYGLAFLVN